ALDCGWRDRDVGSRNSDRRQSHAAKGPQLRAIPEAVQDTARREAEEVLLKAGAWQNAILNSANSSIATVEDRPSSRRQRGSYKHAWSQQHNSLRSSPNTRARRAS